MMKTASRWTMRFFITILLSGILVFWTEDSFLPLVLLLGLPVLGTGSITVLLDGKQVRFPDQRPEIIDNLLFLPLRPVLENLGGTIKWKKITRTALAEWKGQEIKVRAGTNRVSVNGSDISIEAQVYMKNKRLMVPLSFFNEVIKVRKVEWIEVTRTVIISEREEPRRTYYYKGYTLPKESRLYSRAFPVDDEGGVEFEVFISLTESSGEQESELKEVLASKFGKEIAQGVVDWVRHKKDESFNLAHRKFVTTTGHRIFVESLSNEPLVWISVLK